MATKPPYEELEKRVKELEKGAYKCKQAEEMLQEIEERFHSLYENAPLPYQALDENGYFLDVNPPWVEELGYSREEVLGQWFGDFLVPEYVYSFQQFFPRFKAAGEIYGVEFEMVRKDGSTLFVSFNGKIAYDKEGRFKQTHCVFQNITARKQAEEALQESEENFRELAERSPLGVVIADRKANHLYVNKRFAEITGYSTDELIAMNGFEVLTRPEDKRKYIEKMKKRMKSEPHKEGYERVLLRKDGTEVLTEFFITKTKWKGEMCPMVIVQDITRSQQAKEQIQASLKEKEALLGEIHHRVKNNLQIISSLLEMRVMRTDNKEMINVFEDTRSKIYTMALIHEQLYRSENFNEINIGVYIRELVNYLSQVYAGRNASITPYIESSGVYLSITQAIPCALVVNELITNAYKHAFTEGQKGTIQISLKKTDLDEISFQVKDNGIGIPKDIDIYTTNSLGFKLLRNTVQDQLMGRLSLQRGSGTTIVVEFKILKEE